MVKIVAAERGITAGRQHFKHAATQAQNRNIKSTAAKVIDRDHAFLTGIQAISDRRSGRFVQQTQYVQARQTRGVFRPLTLCIVKVSRNGDHYAIQFAGQRFGCPRGQRFQNVSGYAHRIKQTGSGFNHRQAVFARLE